MCTVRSLATTDLSLFSILHLCDDIAKGKRQNKVEYEKLKYPVFLRGRGKPINQPTQVMWSGFSTMLVWTQENVWNWVLLERGTNLFVVWTGLKCDEMSGAPVAARREAGAAQLTCCSAGSVTHCVAKGLSGR